MRGQSDFKWLDSVTTSIASLRLTRELTSEQRFISRNKAWISLPNQNFLVCDFKVLRLPQKLLLSRLWTSITTKCLWKALHIGLHDKSHVIFNAHLVIKAGSVISSIFPSRGICQIEQRLPQNACSACQGTTLCHQLTRCVFGYCMRFIVQP